MFRDKSYLVVLAILGGLATFPLALPSSFSIDSKLDHRVFTFPTQLGAWRGQDVPVDELTYEILETRNVLSRLYQNDQGQAVHLLVVGSEKDRRVAHPPEVCYTSSHYQILQSKDSSFEVGGTQIPVRQFVAQDQRNLSRKEQVLYVYKVGNRYTANYYAQQLRFAIDRLTRNESRILLIRLSSNSDEAFGVFLSEILPHLS